MKRLAYYGLFQKTSDCENLISNAFMKAGIEVFRWQKEIGTVHSKWGEFIDFVKKENIDTVLISKAPEIKDYDLVDLKSKTKCKIVFWTFDYMANPTMSHWYFPQGRIADVCFQSDGNGEEAIYESQGIRRVELHQGLDPTIHYKGVEREEYKTDIAFFGSLYTDRRKELDRFLREHYGDRYKLWGGRGGFERGLWNKDFRDAIASTKIVIGDNYRNDIKGYWSDRVYLTLGCSGFFLTAHVPGIEKVFEIEKQLVTWDSFGDLQRKIDYYLDKPEERERISKCGYDNAHNKHTYDMRVSKIIEYMEKM